MIDAELFKLQISIALKLLTYEKYPCNLWVNYSVNIQMSIFTQSSIILMPLKIPWNKKLLALDKYVLFFL